MKRRRNLNIKWLYPCHNIIVWLKYYCCFWILIFLVISVHAETCPPSEAILPCRCSLRGKEIQIWCTHSNLPQVMDGIKAIERNIKSPIDELVLENNQLPALPGRFFGTLQIVRLMLRYNSIERVSNGWLNELENSLVEIYIVEPLLRSIPVDSLNGMINMIAITIQSEELKHLPNFSGLLSLTYLNVQSKSLTELQPHLFRHLPKVQNIHINGGPNLNRLEAGLFDSLISLKNIDLSRNGINWIHLRAFRRLPNLISLKLSYNEISDVGMIGRIVKDLENLKKLRLDHNIINIVEDGSFVDLPHFAELHLNDNRITELQYGAFLRTPMLKTIYLHNNHIKRIHPESFLQASGSGVETVYIYNNEIEHIEELRSLLNALPALKFLDISNNYLTEIPYGAVRGHGTLEQLHLNNNLLRVIERDALMAMPALRELRIRNNSLSHELPMPFWNLPGLKGLDLSLNNFRTVNSFLLAGLPSLRRLDLSENGLSNIDPATFIHNPMLETLNISMNELISIHPATLRNLDRLFEVDASYNQMVEFIPGLPKIVERVSVHGNMISSLPPPGSKSLELPNLRMLDVSENRLEYLPKNAFQGVPQLRVLSLANNQLRGIDDTTFIGPYRLELLHLQDNALTHVDESAFLPLPELRNLNLQGNKLEKITDNMFAKNTHLEQLDISRNVIRSIAPSAFAEQRSLEYLDLSGNALSDISISLSHLVNLRDLDLSYNQISRLPADVISSWRSVVEVRLSNNLIGELKHGTFHNLPKLQYLDLSSNEINSVEPSALKHLPELQEFVLADNKLVELKDHVFEDLPNLLASHFQYNMLRYISPESFYNTPSMVFLNLSNNAFQNMENIGLRSMRNLEVLDLSMNAVKLVSTMPLKNLNWLVELKIDNNQICKIQGSPFDTMPRLRVLSMRNNRLRTIKEPTFRNLRGNIAILDVEGNPIVCSCEMQWLSVWLQETNFPYPGPKCQDGRLLRETRMEKALCTTSNEVNQRASGGSSSYSSDTSNVLPLLNEHGDIFQRDLPDEFNEECDVYEVPPGQRPLAGESEYFYDQYVDYTPAVNETNSLSTDSPSTISGAVSHISAHKRPQLDSNIDLNNTVLNTKYFNRRPPQQVTSPFTFFGYPLPSLSLGRFFDAGQRGRKDRGENTNTSLAARKSSSVSTSSANMPVTHRMHSPRGKTRMYQPNSAEFEKYLNQETQYQDVTSRNRYVDSNSEETTSNETPTGIFKTGFREPSNVERGGFRPIVPEQVGGFMPVPGLLPRPGKVESVNTTPTSATIPQKRANANSEQNLIPATNQQGSKGQNYRPTTTSGNMQDKNTKGQIYKIDMPSSTPSPQHITPPTTEEEIELQTYYVSESAEIDASTPPTHVTLPATRLASTTSATTTTTTSSTTTTTTAPSETSANNTFSLDQSLDTDLYDDLEAQNVGILKPPPLPETTTAETILLIPPPEEHVEQIKRHSWVTTPIPTLEQGVSAISTTQQYAATTVAPNVHAARPSGGRSTITKVFTPQTLNHYLPTAEEFYRTTTPHHEPTAADATINDDQQVLADSQQRDFHLPVPEQTDEIERKDGMDWYYESFKKKRTSDNAHVSPGSSLRSGEIDMRQNGAKVIWVGYAGCLVGQLLLYLL